MKKTQEKISRICWNTYQWMRPSGAEGKSRVPGSYECDYGFGHEEWLLDNTRVLPDGYHYGFLEPLNVCSGKHIGQVYDIHLFAISPDKQKVYIGCIRNAECISGEQSKKAYQYYQKLGWIEEQKAEILFVGGTPKDFEPEIAFNVRFKIEDAELNHSNRPIIKKDSIGHRYNLMDMKGSFEFEVDDDGELLIYDICRHYHNGTIWIDPLHKKMQNVLNAALKPYYSHLTFESGVDVKGVHLATGEWHYFEIKTYSAKRSIRESLGQILEYNHYPCAKRAEKLFIVGPERPDKNDIAYLKKLREDYHLPIWFRWLSMADKKLHEEV